MCNDQGQMNGTQNNKNTYANGLLDALLLIFDAPNSNTGGV